MGNPVDNVTAVDAFWLGVMLAENLGQEIDREKLMTNLLALSRRELTLLPSPAEAQPENRELVSNPEGRYWTDLQGHLVALRVLREMAQDHAG